MSKKQLIIHMDDMGSSHAANAAGIALFKKGIVTSCSVMMPCAYAYDFIRWWKDNPQYDTGIHFTLTCEWDNAKWRPVGERSKTASLWSPEGFMWQGNDSVVEHAMPAHVYHELDAQIQLALAWGLKPSHLDRHMHTVMMTDAMYKIYVELAKKYDICLQLVKGEWTPCPELETGSPPLDYLIGVGDDLYETLRNLKPGVTQITIHPVIDTPEIRYIIPGWEERVREYELFMGDGVLDAVRECGIELVGYGGVGVSG